MKVFLHYQDNDESSLHKTLKITLPKSWKNGPTSKLLNQFVESYNANETLGASNSLDPAQMHLALRQRKEGETSSPLDPIASDAITLEAIEDRADVYVMHGPSLTIAEMISERAAQKTEEEAKTSNLVACTHFGCKNRFPRGGPYPSCSYHVSPPVFHETAKFWSCCPQKKAYDWDDFQLIPGCRTGVCTDVKEDAKQKEFLGGCDLREQAGEAVKLRSIDDFNKAQAAGGSDAAPVLDRLRSVLVELGVEAELYDQVIEGMKKDSTDAELDGVAEKLGAKLKDFMKAVAVEQLRIK